MTINNTIFPNTKAERYWSSTDYYNAGYAWCSDFDYGSISVANKTSEYYVRCITDNSGSDIWPQGFTFDVDTAVMNGEWGHILISD